MERRTSYALFAVLLLRNRTSCVATAKSRLVGRSRHHSVALDAMQPELLPVQPSEKMVEKRCRQSPKPEDEANQLALCVITNGILVLPWVKWPSVHHPKEGIARKGDFQGFNPVLKRTWSYCINSRFQ
jgi:hypothetical protein